MGKLDEPTGHRTLGRFLQECWLTPRALRPELERSGELVDRVGSQTRAQVARSVGRHHGPSDKSARHPGELVDTEGVRYGPRVVRDGWSTLRAIGPEPRVPREIWSTPWSLGPGPESPRTAGQTRGPSEQGASRQGQQVDLASHWNQARSTRECCSTPRALTDERESPGRADRARGTRDTGPGRPGEKVDCADIWTLARVQRDSWSTIGPSESSLRPPGQLVKPTGPRIRARDARESWSNPRDLGLGPEWPGTDGRPGQPSDTGLSRP